MAEIPVGTKGQRCLLVTPEVTVDFLGPEEARVLGTPHLIGYLEVTARDTVQPFLEPGYDTVGTHVDVRHLAATPIGMAVTFRAEVTAVNERRITFRVEAFDEKEKIAEGTHERFIIHVGRFAAKVQAKRAEAAS
ncbi:MAG: thioesterase family protein [Bryobacterales bacterium]|nr:thioesterase family protein [Bryobacterales bacterium]